MIIVFTNQTVQETYPFKSFIKPPYLDGKVND